MSTEKRSIESLKLEHRELITFFATILGLAITVSAGVVAGWLLEKIMFNVETIERLIIFGLVIFIIENNVYEKMKRIRREINTVKSKEEATSVGN